MPQRNEIAYFGAGPAGLPTQSIQTAADAFVNFGETGLGLAEISHRSSTASEILAEARTNLKKLLSIPEDYEVIFAHGGGSGAFASVVLNMVGHWAAKERAKAFAILGNKTEADVQAYVRERARDNLRLDYLITGSWSLKASQEAADLLSTVSPNAVRIVADAREANELGKFGSIPSESSWRLCSAQKDGTETAALTYYCDNETVDGVEFPGFPAALDNGDNLVVADMSSNILTRHVDVSKYAVIFAGAQKNVGITDTTILIIRKSILAEQVPKSYLLPTPAIMHWPTLAKHGSLYNTIPIFSLFVAADVMQHLLSEHGTLVTGSQSSLSQRKAEAIYNVLDTNTDLYQVCADRQSRSRMNICFRIRDGNDELEKRFVVEAEKRRLLGLKGHRSVGGIRISNYNSVTLNSMRKLESFLSDFTKELRKTGLNDKRSVELPM